VRSVMVGLGTGLIGGGMIAPLGPIYANQVLHAGAACRPCRAGCRTAACSRGWSWAPGRRCSWPSPCRASA
jgi:hypothetical protein